MKILSPSQIRDADAYTIQQKGIISLDLMETAASQCTDWILDRFPEQEHFTIHCGMGNNGGDGLVIARQLAEADNTVSVCLWNYSDKASADNLSNQKRLNQLKINIHQIDEDQAPPAPHPDDIIIDALFGSGLSRPLDSWVEKYVLEINRLPHLKISIDLPSGLFMSRATDPGQTVFQADYTLSFQVPKLALYLPENDPYVGEWQLLHIGLEEDFIESCPSDYETLDSEHIGDLILPRLKYSHKGSYGHALIIAGSLGKTGAAILATQACLRGGAGLVSVHCPKVAYPLLQATCPEAMVISNRGRDHHTRMKIDLDYRAAGIGPGLGLHDETHSFFKYFLKKANSPLVLDADAINIIAQDLSLLDHIPAGSIFTPHPKEFERLAGSFANSYERIEKQIDLAQRTQSCVLVKGAHTCIASPKAKVYFNTTGNPGMATGGSGDVLTGILTALLAQGYTTVDACRVGVYWHGLAGDLAAREQSEQAMIAGDLVAFMGKAWLQINPPSKA